MSALIAPLLTSPLQPLPIPESAPVPVQKEDTPSNASCSAFDWTTFYYSILSHIQIAEEDNPSASAEDIAMTIIAMDPDMLSSLCHFLPSEVSESCYRFALENPHRKLRSVADELYISSLQNSRFRDIVTTLENTIIADKFFTSKEQLQILIEYATTLIGTPCAETLPKIEAQISQQRLVEVKICERIAIFCYVDPKYHEPMKRLIFHAPFPQCQKYFSNFVQNLQIATHELTQLRTLLGSLRAQQAKLVELAKPFYAADTSGQLSEEKELFFQGHFELFWNTGILIIQEAFQETFTELRKRKVDRLHLPNEFRQALRKTQKDNTKWKLFNPRVLMTETQTIKDTIFICTFVGHMKGDSPEDLMRKYLYSLPEDWLLILKQTIQTASNPESALLQQFKQDLGMKKPTLSILKKWGDSNTIP